MSRKQPDRSSWVIPLGLLIAAVLVLWTAPEERTLGQGIKVVYLHVALTWTGMAGLIVAGLLGVGAALAASERLLALLKTISRVSIGLFGTGFAVSMLAAWINWGGVFWDEPRTLASLNALVIAVLIQAAGAWFPWRRLHALAHALPAAFLLWSTWSAPLVLHPRNPILTSASTPIRLTFLGMFAICSLAAAWLVRALVKRQRAAAAVESRTG